MKSKYNWWEDPNNKEEVERISWWEHPENKTTIELPVSLIHTDNQWCIGTNKETEECIGKHLGVSTSGDTKEEAIANFFSSLKIMYPFERSCRLKYQRWVPFRKGNWKHIGGTWFVIFGIHVYIRRGKGMKGGWYIPFTKLNISIHNEWKYKIKDNED